MIHIISNPTMTRNEIKEFRNYMRKCVSMNFTLEEVRDDIMADYNLCSLICEEVEYDKLMEQIEANRKV